MFVRLAEKRARSLLDFTRVVLINGPRQSGKTTLAKAIATSDMQYYSLDDPTTANAARTDPVNFVRGIDRAVIDEVQRVPELLLAIKTSVDEDPRPGRFLFAGSANLMTLPKVADSFAGRMSVQNLLPLVRCEIFGTEPTFLDSAFSGELPNHRVNCIIGDALVDLVLKGGYPEPLTRSSPGEREIWHEDYIELILQRDIRDIGQIRQLSVLPRLVRILAESAAMLTNASKIGSLVGLNHVTTRDYMTHLSNLYLISLLPPWYGNKLKRLVKTPKLHFLDSGLLGTLRNTSIEKIRRDRSQFGPILESFVYSEILKLANASANRFDFYHYRDKDQKEVDLVIEDRRGKVVGIEVKANSTVTSKDFGGLRRLADDVGDRLVYGFVLYDHDRPVSFGERLVALPISSLWN